jgi:hypothetical protein
MEKYQQPLALFFGMLTISAMSFLIGLFAELTWDVTEWFIGTRFIVAGVWVLGLAWVMSQVE